MIRMAATVPPSWANHYCHRPKVAITNPHWHKSAQNVEQHENHHTSSQTQGANHISSVRELLSNDQNNQTRGTCWLTFREIDWSNIAPKVLKCTSCWLNKARTCATHGCSMWIWYVKKRNGMLCWSKMCSQSQTSTRNINYKTNINKYVPILTGF